MGQIKLDRNEVLLSRINTKTVVTHKKVPTFSCFVTTATTAKDTNFHKIFSWYGACHWKFHCRFQWKFTYRPTYRTL